MVEHTDLRDPWSYWTNIFLQGLGLPYGPESGQFLNGNLWKKYHCKIHASSWWIFYDIFMMDLYDISMVLPCWLMWLLHPAAAKKPLSGSLFWDAPLWQLCHGTGNTLLWTGCIHKVQWVQYNSPLKQGIEAIHHGWRYASSLNFLEKIGSLQCLQCLAVESPFEKHAPNAQTRGHPSILVCETGEQKPCVMMLDKTIRTLAICEGKASKKDCMHEKHGNTTSFCLGDWNSRRHILGRNCSHQTLHSWHPSVCVASIVPESRLICCTQRDRQDRQLRLRREPGEVHDLNDLNDSMFHTTPAKFVTLGDASISEVSAKHCKTSWLWCIRRAGRPSKIGEIECVESQSGNTSKEQGCVEFPTMEATKSCFGHLKWPVVSCGSIIST